LGAWDEDLTSHARRRKEYGVPAFFVKTAFNPWKEKKSHAGKNVAVTQMKSTGLLGCQQPAVIRRVASVVSPIYGLKECA